MAPAAGELGGCPAGGGWEGGLGQEAPGRGWWLWPRRSRVGALSSPQRAGPAEPAAGQGRGEAEGLGPGQQGRGCPLELGGDLGGVRPFPGAAEVTPVQGREPRSVCGHTLPGLFSLPERSPAPRRFLGERIARLREPLGKLAAVGKNRRTLPPPAWVQPCRPPPPPPALAVMSLPCSASRIIFLWAALGLGGCPLPSAVAATERLRSESLPSPPPGDLWLWA